MTATASPVSARTAAAGIEVHPLTAAVGAQIRGVDLASVDDVQFAQIESAWSRHSALLFRAQRLDHDALIAFSRRFGELDRLCGFQGWTHYADQVARESVRAGHSRECRLPWANYFPLAGRSSGYGASRCQNHSAQAGFDDG